MTPIGTRVRLSEAARRLGVTMKDVLYMVDRGEIVADIDRVDGRIYIPADQLPD